MSKPLISEIKPAFLTKPLNWNSALSAVILETNLLPIVNAIKVLNPLRMMGSGRVQICVGDDGIALVNLYFRQAVVFISQQWSSGTLSHCIGSFSLLTLI